MADNSKTITGNRLNITLQRITYDVVSALGYIGAMVSTYEPDGALPIRAFYVDPNIATMEQINNWQARIAQILGQPVDLTDPTFARVYVDQKEFRDNLSVQAARKRRPVTSQELNSLFTPIVPTAAKPLVNGVIQRALGIKEVIAVPFFLETVDNTPSEIVGNLFVAKDSPITNKDQLVLTAFGRQAAAAIEIERHRQQTIQVAKQLTTEIQTHMAQEEFILKQIVHGVVNVLGYVGAMVATYEEDDSLPVRAAYFNPSVATPERMEKWETMLSRAIRRPINFNNLDPDFARVYVHEEKYRENLSVQAVKSRRPVVNDDLYALFTPVVPSVTKPVFNTLIQRALNIKQVIAVPFFLEMAEEEEAVIVGNLFAATTRSEGFQAEEIELLQTFGQQAAAGIRNARLYREIGELYGQAKKQRREIEELYAKAEERRQVAEVFGKMAFSAAAYVHDLRNHTGAIRSYLQLLHLMPDAREEMLKEIPNYLNRLNRAADILDNLHEPWRQMPDTMVDVNACLRKTLEKIMFPPTMIAHRTLQEEMPSLKTSPDMLIETFRIIIKNAIEALAERADMDEKGEFCPTLWVESQFSEPAGTITVMIRDNGIGIRKDNLDKIFEMRWSTKSAGMGFGLFWAQDYVQGLGGDIFVQSERLEGTTFQVELPAHFA